jgi:hypothetical protein
MYQNHSGHTWESEDLYRQASIKCISVLQDIKISYHVPKLLSSMTINWFQSELLSILNTQEFIII